MTTISTDMKTRHFRATVRAMCDVLDIVDDVTVLTLPESSSEFADQLERVRTAAIGVLNLAQERLAQRAAELSYEAYQGEAK